MTINIVERAIERVTPHRSNRIASKSFDAGTIPVSDRRVKKIVRIPAIESITEYCPIV